MITFFVFVRNRVKLISGVYSRNYSTFWKSWETGDYRFIYSSISIFSAPKENSNSNFSSLSDIFSAPQKSIQKMSKFSSYPMYNSDIFSFFYFELWWFLSNWKYWNWTVFRINTSTKIAVFSHYLKTKIWVDSTKWNWVNSTCRDFKFRNLSIGFPSFTKSALFWSHL